MSEVRADRATSGGGAGMDLGAPSWGGADATRVACAMCSCCTLAWHTPIYILLYGIGYGILSQIHRICHNFAIYQ